MPLSLSIRIAVLMTALSTAALAQSPTIPPSDAQATIQAPATPAQMPSTTPTISYSDGLVAVTANNSSLNQILSAISQQVGIRITGGVTDERVFGNYGPEPPARVLSELLDGTGVNMMLVQASGSSPTELILTQRNGGPSPPNPNAIQNDQRAIDQRRVYENRFNDPRNQGNQPQQRSPFRVNPNQNQPINPASATQSPPATATQQSPNDVKTPQQIYEQLQQMRQQQQNSTH